MKTISTYEIYRAAYDCINTRKNEQVELNLQTIRFLGRENDNAKRRIEKYNAQLFELREAMIQELQEEEERQKAMPKRYEYTLIDTGESIDADNGADFDRQWYQTHSERPEGAIKVVDRLNGTYSMMYPFKIGR